MQTIGAEYLGDGQCSFTVWAPEKQKMTLQLVHPEERIVEMKQDKWGCFQVTVQDVFPGTRYFFIPDEEEKGYPDPASHYQPEGVHGPSEVMDHSTFEWHDQNWRNIAFQDMVLYEAHVGTLTPESTFEAIIPLLDDLAATGINAIELMPVAQFPGNRNWGYDGVDLYAVQNSYGGPDGLKKLVDACHARGIAVFLDVVYNHVGPEGNYFSKFGPYFTDKYKTPWGEAINYDGDWSDGVRDYFTGNALHWFRHYHLDGLRLDAIHTIYDDSAVSFWELLHRRVKQLQQEMGKPLYLVAESDLNSPRVIRSPELGGMGFDAQWLDDFHHTLYVLLHPPGKKFYEDFGQPEQLAKAYTDGFVLTGEYVNFRKRTYGASSAGVPGDRFVAFLQNHDQIGNRVKGERMSQLVSFEKLKLGAAAILLAPYVPMLFMGEEYGEDAPFLYFVSHSDTDLIEAVREGRKKEFSRYKWEGEPADPQSEETFNSCKLQWQKRKKGHHKVLEQWHRQLIWLRKEHPVLKNFEKKDVQVHVLEQRGFVLQRQTADGLRHLHCLFNLSDTELSYTFSKKAADWKKILDSKEEKWLGKEEAETKPLPTYVKAEEQVKLAPLSIAVYEGKL
ncbi:malto-oligosyltrehalose trehalohydrolase [Pontibacter ruber]|uniref:Malto-oligosyltrehalose trehalohydrolase n=1 Tax=Pontibacter ruber TaxID=1343895 RepID=A0ABW5D2N5_9BACT|nr:malto-oligosyltrehalose trehalohydrolase [Pontibacter ruber]